ncbi:hypothetical protein WA577_002883, partial [Blastocystis sp. JDR]
MSSYMIEHSEDFERKTLIEIGCGTGLLSILACQLGAHVIATDYLEEVLDLARANAERNGIPENQIRFQKLDLLDEEAIDTLCSTSPSVDWVIASDMIYDELLTESFCYVMASSLRHFDCYCLLSGEHRFNFLASSLSTVDYEFGVFKQFVCFK